jgi:putative membrane protein
MELPEKTIRITINEGANVDKKNGSLAVRFVKGFIIGASMLVPGASGGTMAIILGIYDELIHAVSTLRQNFKENAILLGTYIIAGCAGILLLSHPMLAALELWNKPMLFLFLGAILGGIPPLYRKVKISRIKPVNLLVALVGALIGISTTYLPEGLFQLSTGFNLFNFTMLILAGVIIAIALILPGISASYVLLMLGMYHLTLIAIKQFDLFYLVPLAIGVIGGTFLTAGILEREMKRHPQFTYMLIIGFMLGSLVQVFPGIPDGNSILSCILSFITGLAAILWLGRKRKY